MLLYLNKTYFTSNGMTILGYLDFFEHLLRKKHRTVFYFFLTFLCKLKVADVGTDIF